MTSQAMYAMLKRKDTIRDGDRDVQRNTQTQKTVLTNEEKEDILADNQGFKAAEANLSACWETWRAFYNDKKEEPNMRKRQAVIKSGLRPEFNVDDEEVAVHVPYTQITSLTRARIISRSRVLSTPATTL